jgi:phage N-6-adenine-methyltransferase
VKKGTKAVFTSQTDNWKTPEAFYQALDAEFHFDCDPCPLKPTRDGLQMDWGKSNFVNPPYSDLERWILKGYEESKNGKTSVFLIPARTSNGWFHEYCLKAKEIRFIRGRLKFGDGKSNAPFPSCIVIF